MEIYESVFSEVSSVKKAVFICRALDDKSAAGIHRYTLEILKELDRIVQPGEIEVLIPSFEMINYEFSNIAIIQIGVNIKSMGKIGEKASAYLYKNYFAYKYIKKQNAISADFLLQFPLFGCDLIAIHDCRVNLFPEYYTFSKEQNRIRNAVLKHQNKAIKKCKKIITVSQTAKKDITKVYKDIDKPIEIIYNAWQHFDNIQDDTHILEKLGLKSKQFFFALGSGFPHKNFKWIISAAKQHPELRFVVSGKNVGDKTFDTEILDNLIYAGRLSDEEVKALMRHCKAFIQPSLYEGFGIPPLEAMSVGADCIVSDIPVFREVYKDSVWYIDPEEYEHIDFNQIMSKEKEDNEIILEKYSWKESAEKLLPIIRGLAKE